MKPQVGGVVFVVAPSRQWARRLLAGAGGAVLVFMARSVSPHRAVEQYLFALTSHSGAQAVTGHTELRADAVYALGMSLALATVLLPPALLRRRSRRWRIDETRERSLHRHRVAARFVTCRATSFFWASVVAWRRFRSPQRGAAPLGFWALSRCS